jgi:hypothetical protein
LVQVAWDDPSLQIASSIGSWREANDWPNTQDGHAAID